MSARLQTLLVLFGGMLFSAGAGWVAFYWPIGAPLERLSYDLPYSIRGNRTADEVRIVYLDEESADALQQPRSGLWSRKTHAQLVRRLTLGEARAVFFDLIFDQASEEPGADEEFAAALKENGRTFLGDAFDQTSEKRGALEAVMEQVRPPTITLQEAIAGDGTVAFNKNPDFGVRSIHTGTEQVPAATWEMARFVGAALPEEPEERLSERWMNYYGPTGTMTGVSYHRAIQPDGVAPGYFKDKVVFVGGRNRLARLPDGKDTFFVPYSRWGYPFMPGIEVHANTFLNLLHQTWLTRGRPWMEGAAVIVIGLMVGGLLAWLRPVMAVVVAVIFAFATFAGAWAYLQQTLIWYNWLVPIVVQTPAALAWSLTANYFFETRKREQIEKAFSRYLSPEMAKDIAKAGFDLTPGGSSIEATMIFTDIQGFAEISEELDDPKRISDLLIDYFTQTTQHVFDGKGTIIKYIGDAVFAAWGAPRADREHAVNAVRAAWGMHLSAENPVSGQQLVTRIGINTGEVLAGNLGSKFRFDYTLIGDPVNVASRLEGLNKTLGTRVLLTETTLAKLGGKFATRRLGDFRVIGRKKPVAVHELLGPAEDYRSEPWQETFREALALFQAREFEMAATIFGQVAEERGAPDGPAEFYLKEIAVLRRLALPPDWAGAVDITVK